MALLKGVRRIQRLRRNLAAMPLISGLCLGLTTALAKARAMPKTSPQQKIAGHCIVVLRDSINDAEVAIDWGDGSAAGCVTDKTNRSDPACLRRL